MTFELCKEFSTKLTTLGYLLNTLNDSECDLSYDTRREYGRQIDALVASMAELDAAARKIAGKGCMEIIEGMRELLAPA